MAIDLDEPGHGLVTETDDEPLVAGREIADSR